MMRLSELAQAVQGRMLGEDVMFGSVGSDSRKIEKNQLFVAIKGEKFDGNAYAAQAITQGAAAALVSEAAIQPAVLVPDTRIALGQLAQYWREKQALKLVAVTGSNGKTTVKEMIAAILNVARNGAVLATQGNLNNDIGMPLTLLKLNDSHKFAVIEMGMNHEGEIRYLTKLAKPDVAVVNNAGTAHIGELGSREAIARAKGEIYEGLSDKGIAIINADDRFADYWRGLNTSRKILTFGMQAQADVRLVQAEKTLKLETPQGAVDLMLNVLGEHNLRNALAAAAVAMALEIPLAAIQLGLREFGGVQGRLMGKAGKGGALVIDDTYNANPDSMKAALDVLAGVTGNKIFIMGDMGELGEDSAKMHAEIGDYAKQQGVNVLLALGKDTAHAVQAFGVNGQYFTGLEALLQAAAGLMQNGATVLVKGSRFMQMERVVNALVEEKLRAEAH